MKNIKKTLYLFLSSFLFIGVDWYTKNWAKRHLFYVQSKSYFNGIFTLDYAENKGAALSLGSNLPPNQAFWLLQIVPLIILLLVLIYVLFHLSNLGIFKILCFAAIISGGLANLIDRFLYNRHVIDFMIIEWGWLKTGIFNFADIFISVGVIGLLIESIFGND